jgi:5-(carboxyamino)imidazole ribonucleotide synthase
VTTVGILGGGQLARMLALAGAPLGLRFLVMDQAADACAAQFVPQLKADYTDEAALAEFASKVDVVTFDFENVPAESAQWLAGKVPVFPSPRALAVAQDRLAEKTLFNDLGIATPRFSTVASRPDLDRALAEIGAPCILKTRRLGYDGKGQFRLSSEADADAAWAALGAQAGSVGLILEGFVAFQRELSVIAVRARDGAFRAWPLTQNWHASGILSASLAPADAGPALIDQALAHARAVAEELDYVGVFALELFERDGELPSKAPSAASSRTTFAPCSGCLWAAARRAVAPACSTGSGRCQRPTQRWRWPPCTGMTTASRHATGARSGMRPRSPKMRAGWSRS